MASLSLLDLQTLRQFYRLNRFEFTLSLLATIGVIWVGAIDAIGVAVVLALVHFIRLTARPRAEILGEVEGLPGFHSVARHPTALSHPGLLLFRFNAPLVFFNAPHFKQQAQAAIAAAGPDLKWFVLDALPVTQLDITAYGVLDELAQTLRARGAELMLAGRMTEVIELRTSVGIGEGTILARYFPTLEEAVLAYRATLAAARVNGGSL
jgi:MFS superfamily sulfate permease-like transporter